MNKSTASSALLGFVFFLAALNLQSQTVSLFGSLGNTMPAEVKGEPILNLRKAQYLNFNTALYAAEGPFLTEGKSIALPMPEGGLETFIVLESAVMPQEMKDAFPQIETANIVSASNKGKWGKVTFTHKGFYAMVFEIGKSPIFIDPVIHGNNTLHAAYRKSDFSTDKQMDCIISADEMNAEVNGGGRSEVSESYNSCELRTYRIAIAATGEYTIFHGGTVEDALAAIVVSLARVTGIYERDFGVSFTLIPDNELVIFDDPQTDPYTNGNAFAMLNENQQTLITIIGSQNFDIGHVYGTNSGGVASLGSVCNANQKGRGVTGSGSPIGDPFDVDYVAHEIGHQFGARHTYNNSCNGNRSDIAAYEPGSGSTIMAYAGICNPNVQNQSDDHFHGISLSEVGVFITNASCAVVTDPGNTAPFVSDLAEDIYVPANTPFALSAQAVDIDLDSLTYNWEQMDREITFQPPSALAQEGPNFRSYPSSPHATRYLPRLEALAFNQQLTWERLPEVERTMRFRLSVRDNNPLVGCTQYAETTVNVIDTGEPFELTYPQGNGIVWQGLGYETVTWEVAGTDLAPINSEFIDLYLSVTPQLNFDTLLAAGVPNTGSYTVLVPNVGTTTARVMARAATGQFFDISRQNFTIEVIEEGFAFITESLSETACVGDELSFSVSAVFVGNSLQEPIELDFQDLPQGVTVTASEDVLEADGEVVLTVSTSIDSPLGNVDIVLNGQSGNLENSLTLTLNLLPVNLEPAIATAPADGAMQVSINAGLQWEGELGESQSFSIEISEDPSFASLAESATGIFANAYFPQNLESETSYFWRVRKESICGISDYSEVFAFDTYACLVNLISEEEVSINMSVESVALSTIEVASNETIADIGLRNINGIHSDISQLHFRLQSAEHGTVNLGATPCGVDLNITSTGGIVVTQFDGVTESFGATAPAAFGPGVAIGGTSGKVVFGYDQSANSDLLCNNPVNGAVLEGKIALVRRGTCPFVQKVINAQEAGAIGVVVINSEPGFFDMGGQGGGIEIPSVMVSPATGAAIEQALASLPGDFSFGFSDFGVENGSPCLISGAGPVVKPLEPLNDLIGLTAAGDWTLEVLHPAGTAQGILVSWELDMCTIDLTLSTGDVEEAGLQVYPNPSNAQITVAWTDAQAFRTLSITDISGRQVSKFTVEGSASLQIDLGAYSNGLYMVQLEGRAGRFTSKVLKVN